MKKEMLINVLQPEECRIAILEDGILEELYVERTSQESYVGNVYKGRIVNIEPSIQAAFIDFGIGRNGFLHVSDVDPAYYRHVTRGGGRGGRDEGRRGFSGDRPPPPPPREERFERPREEPHGRKRDDRRPRRHDEYDEEPRGRRNPPVAPPLPPVPPPSRTKSDDFADGLFDQPAPRSIPAAAAAPSVSSPTPVQHHDDDPYAALIGEFGHHPTEPAAGPDEETERRRRSRDRHESQEPEPTREPVAEAPPPLPKPDPAPVSKAEVDTFGAGIDLWGDELPPPYMPSAERRTGPDDDFGAGLLDAGGGEAEEPVGRFDSDESAEEGGRFDNDDSDEDGGRFDSDESAIDEGRDDDDDDNDEDSEGEDGGAPFRQRRPQGQRREGGGFRRFRGGRDGDGHQKPLIQDIFKRGQEVIVQVIKEGIGTKGPTLSTYISIAGRYLVLMPGLSRVGVSRKIADVDQRHRLRDILTELQPPPGLGFIIRTAGTDRTKKDLHNDLNYLLRIWQVIVRRIRGLKGPGVIHTESDMITRTIRDTFTTDIDSIWIDEPVAHQHALEFLQAIMPRYASKLKLYDQTEPLFHRYGLDPEIAKIQQKKLPLPGGGSIIIEQTEALVAIDVNSGSFRADSNNAEETAYQINLAAAKEIARQLRLRDLGGVIVNDFIDMKDDKHRRAVEKAMREAVKRDRARTKVLRISQFGLIEMTRQRIRPSLKRSVFQECGHCCGIGYVKTAESMSIEVMRLIQLAACRDSIRRLEVRVHAAVADYLVNRRRREIAQLEDKGAMTVLVTGLREVAPERMELSCYDANGAEVPLLPPVPVLRPPQPHHGRGGGGRRR